MIKRKGVGIYPINITPLRGVSDGILQDSAVQHSSTSMHFVGHDRQQFQSYSRNLLGFLVLEELEELASQVSEEQVPV
jgi:hypothetical protein